MKRIASSSVGILQGSRVLFADFAVGGMMWTGQGERESRHLVTFAEAFVAPPTVHVSISMWDVDNQHNARADISAEHVSEIGFQLVFRTWGDSRIARVRADWMAIGAAKDEDDWQLY